VIRTGAPAADEAMEQLLQLLADEAPAEAFDRLAAAVEAGQAGPDRDLMLLALARAGRVRELLAHRKRREKETQALFDSARDLSSLRDVDQVLEAIAQRARRLLGTDAAYLALVEPASGEAYMRITLGTVTTAIESVRQRPGLGVGGRILYTGRPYATANYLRDATLRRDPSVTDAVIEDGLVSIAGVPMRLGDAVVGVLFVANRYERTFEASEIALLSSLADHASIVIENARLFAKAEAAAQELREANTELSRHGQALQRAGAAHEQLMPMALRRADVTELAETVATMLDGAVTALGVDGQVLATAGPPDIVDPATAVDAAALDPLEQGARPGTARRVEPGAGAAETWAVPVQAGPEAFGYLLFAARVPLADADVRTLERSAQTAALLLLMERQVSAAEQQVRGELIDDLLAEREPDWTSFRRRASRFGALDFAVPHTVLVLSATGVTRRHLLRAAADYAVRRGGLATEHAARIVLLLPRVDAATAAARVPAELGRATGGEVTAGVAGPATSAPAVRALHRDADRCHRLLLALGRAGQGASTAELGVLGLVLEGTSQRQVQRLLEDTIGPVLRYDAEHGSLLLETLDGYFAAGQNPRAAARALQVHPNTVYQRLDRIDQVLGHERWRKPAGALTMQMALQLHRVLDRIPADELLGAWTAES
jgi:GAF domain-containing protein/sugar diacid utilization regulator